MSENYDEELEWINTNHPEHDRTSCGDDNLYNAGSIQLRHRCERCESLSQLEARKNKSELSACRKELEEAKSHNELYAAEMSGAKEAGWYSAEELFSAYKTLTAERDRLAAQIKEAGEQEPVSIDTPEYHAQGMGCGLEDRNITDRYEAMEYGWDCAIERMYENIPDNLYTHPPIREGWVMVPLEPTEEMIVAACDKDVHVCLQGDSWYASDPLSDYEAIKIYKAMLAAIKKRECMNGLLMKYFVLKPHGNDVYARASRAAMRAYANHISEENQELCNDLRKWADKEMMRAADSKELPWPPF